MAKRRIVYESDDDDDDDDDDRTKRSRTAPDDGPTAVANGTGARRSERSGRGNGGRIAQMKQFERVQTEGSKRASKVDIATQGEEVNPMAPSFLDVGERNSRTGRADSHEAIASRTRRPTQSSLQPQFVQAAPGQQFGFKLPDAVSQTNSDIRAPSRSRFSRVSLQPSAQASGPPSSRSTSLFSGRSLGTNSTAATSCPPPSACSSTGERRLAGQHDLHSQRTQPASQRTASFYNPPLSGNAGHSLSAAPNVEIDEASPSEDERIAEEALHQNEDFLRKSSPLPDDDNGANGAAQRQQSGSAVDLPDDQAPSQMDFQSRDDTAVPQRRRRRAIDRADGTDVDLFDDQAPSQMDFQSRDDTAAPRRRRPRAIDRADGTDVDLSDDQAPSQMDFQSRDDTAAPRRRRPRAIDRADGTDLDGATSQRQRNQPARPASNPVPSQPTLPVQPLVNVVSAHRQRNRAPRLPSNSQLLAARQQQAGAMNIGDGQDRPTGLAVGPATEHSDPWQLHFYDPPTRDVIERAKQFSHCDSASIDPFPIRASFNTKAVEYIDEAIAERRARGLIITDGWWPHHSSSITRLLWEDLGSWRSALRKKARTFVTQRYQWDPDNHRERNIEIAKNLLGSGGLFLRDGSDAEGHVNNLAHPALSGLIIEFFYTGHASVGKLFPEVFAGEVPRVTVAFAATALKVVLDEIASGKGEVNFRVNTYSPVFNEIFALMCKCDTNAIHSAKTRALRKRWAELGSNGMTSQEQVVGGCGFDVSLD